MFVIVKVWETSKEPGVETRIAQTAATAVTALEELEGDAIGHLIYPDDPHGFAKDISGPGRWFYVEEH